MSDNELSIRCECGTHRLTLSYFRDDKGDPFETYLTVDIVDLGEESCVEEFIITEDRDLNKLEAFIKEIRRVKKQNEKQRRK